MNILVFISCVFAATEFAAGGFLRRCYNRCDCKDYEYCMGEEMPICRILKTGELAGEKHCACKSCEDDSSNDDSSDSNVGDRRKRAGPIVCKNNCPCKDWTCPGDQIGYCNTEKTVEGKWICDCKPRGGQGGDASSEDDDEE